MSKILITGGLGFIFSHVTEYLASKAQDVTVVDKCGDGSWFDLKPHLNNMGVRVLKGDISAGSLDQLEKENFDIIIHAAAETNVDKSIEDFRPFILSNIAGTLATLQYARQMTPHPKFLYVNTDEVYGPTEKWCTPEDAQNPTNPYSASKASAGHLCWAWHTTYGMPMQEIRMCNIIGKRQATTKILPRVIDRIKKDEEIPIYDGGKFTREYMDVRDVAPNIERILEDGGLEIFNLTYNQELSVIEVVESVEKMMDKKAKIKHTTRPGHDKRYRITPHKIMLNEIGQKHKFHKIEDTIEWMLAVTPDTPYYEQG